MDLDDFRLFIEVQLMGAVNCCKAVCDVMCTQNYGRIVMTSASSGLYGNFGQANYGAAKMALVGLMQTLIIECAKNNIRVNCLAPTAATRMMEHLMSDAVLKLLQPDAVTLGLLALVVEKAPTRAILRAGAGGFERAHITLTEGIFVGIPDNASEQVAARFVELSQRNGETVPQSGAAQGTCEITKASYALARQPWCGLNWPVCMPPTCWSCRLFRLRSRAAASQIRRTYP